MAVKKGRKWGYINEQGEEVIPCQYEDVEYPSQFSENGLVLVKKENTWIYIDATGKEVISLPEEIVEAKRFKKVE